MKAILKQLIEDNVLDYKRLILKYYHKLNLTENEAIALIKLQDLLIEKEGIIDPKKFSRWLSLNVKDTEALLASLMQKGYLQIKLIQTKSGKEKETFDIDFFITEVINLLNKKLEKTYETVTHQWVHFLEDTLQRPLSPIDIEYVSKWIEEDTYSFDMLKEATLESLKRKNPSLKSIDQNLLKQLENINIKPEKKDVLKEFHRLWEE